MAKSDEQKTLVVEPVADQPAGDRPAGDRPVVVEREAPRNPWPAVARTAIIGAVVVVVLLGGLLIILSAAGHALSSLNPFRDGVVTSTTVDRSGPAVLKSVTDLGELKAASGYYEVIVDVQQDVKPLPSFLAGERTLFLAAGTVDATVDLGDISADDVTVGDDGTSVTLRVPAPVIGEANLDLDRSKVWGSQRGLFDRLKDALGNGSDGDDPAGQEAVYKLGEKRISEAATANSDLSERAQASATTTLSGMLRALGYTDVSVVFEKPDER